ncbi:hypothetical protein FHG87_010609 [Trinorchestia longiramus]|nr:hypothetical protein FHG87_010609 [Trinorchestia longiramus]
MIPTKVSLTAATKKRRSHNNFWRQDLCRERTSQRASDDSQTSSAVSRLTKTRNGLKKLMHKLEYIESSSYWDSETDTASMVSFSALDDTSSNVNFCGANPNLHSSSQTPMGMGPIGGIGPMNASSGTSSMGMNANGLGLINSSIGSSSSEGGMCPTLNQGRNENNLSSSSSTPGCPLNSMADEGGGLIIISAADVNGVLTDGDDFASNENEDFSTDDFGRGLGSDDYTPISDSFSLEQFFPNVNNNEDENILRNQYLNNNCEFNDRNMMIINNNSSSTMNMNGSNRPSSCRSRRDTSSLSSLTSMSSSNFNIKEEPDMYLDEERMSSSGLLTPGPQDSPTFTQLAPAQPYPPLAAQGDQSFASLLKDNCDANNVTSSSSSDGVKRESNSGSNVAAGNPLLAELLASPASDVSALINSINIKSEMKKETLDTPCDSYKAVTGVTTISYNNARQQTKFMMLHCFRKEVG